jgi:CO/xanthine dehydrogenase FAD-binding subunit
LNRFKAPADWVAAPLMRLCCHSLLMSFKICNAATVGGNICMSLPAGSMISLSVALEGVYTLWPRDAKPRNVAAIDFVTENHTNALRPGELLRSIHLPASALEALRLPPLFAHPSRTVGGAHDRHPGCAQRRSPCTVTAATVRPMQLHFDRVPTATKLRHAIDAHISDADYFDDVHGSAAYKRPLTYHYAEQIRAELQHGAAA